MILRPLGDRVLIQPIANRTESAAGLELVEAWQPEQMGTVLAIGTREHPQKAEADALAADMHAHGYSQEAAEFIRSLVRKGPICQPGDRVLFSWQAGQEIFDHDADTRYLLMKADDLIAVIEHEDA